jgi:hypothetical protein
MRFIKLFSGLAGLAAVLVSVPLLVTGVVLFSWAAGGESTTLPTVGIRSTDRAVVAADIDVFAGERAMFIPSVGEARLRVSDDTPLFVGIGPSAEVRRYLADGEGSPLEQSFWVHASDGTSTLVDWQIESGEWTAVVMNADGTPGVDATVQASVPSAPLRVAGAILSIIGVGVGAVGTLLVGAAWGGRQSRRPSETMATA